MNRMERLYKLHDLLKHGRRPIAMSNIATALGVGRNTVMRDLAYLRDFFGAPIIYQREQNGHQYDPAAPVFELPGFWMNASELHALLACEQLLASAQPGLFGEKLRPLKQRIRTLLGDASQNSDQLEQCVQVQQSQARQVDERLFLPVADATLSGQQLTFHYRGRRKNDCTHRQVSPQRLIHYRNNWYLIGWCHGVEALRQFSLDRIEQPQPNHTPALKRTATELDHFAGASFGIFSGSPTDQAHLRFSEQAARWVAEEKWHPHQHGEWQEDGYHLHVPYSDPTELIMEILRYGPDVEVLAPKALRQQIIERIEKMQKIY